MENNFFRLNAIHPVIKDYITYHNASMKVFEASQEYLIGLDERLELEKRDPKIVFDEFHRDLCRLYSEMETSFSNFFISYFAFRALAKAQAPIMTEFKKVPDKIKPVQKQFMEILMGYQEAIGDMKARCTG